LNFVIFIDTLKHNRPIYQCAVKTMNLRDEKLVTVFATGNHAVIALAKSLLDDANINYYAKNERSEDLIGIGVVGTGYNPVIGPIELQVLEENAEEARELLKDLSEGQVKEEE
jgi:hypothetical protein